MTRSKRVSSPAITSTSLGSSCRDGTSIFQDDVKGMDDSRNPTKDCQKDVDEKVCITTPFKEHTERW